MESIHAEDRSRFLYNSALETGIARPRRQRCEVADCPKSRQAVQPSQGREMHRTVEIRLSAELAHARPLRLRICQTAVVESVLIYSLQGRLIRAMRQRDFAPGDLIGWDGKDRSGTIVRNGTYVVLVGGKDFAEAGRMTVK